MSSIPYIACALFTAILGLSFDKIIQLNILSRKNIRKLFNGIGKKIFDLNVIFSNYKEKYLS